MPIKSSKQWRMMQAVANKKGKAKGIGGLTKDVAKEFIKKTPKKKRSFFSRSY